MRYALVLNPAARNGRAANLKGALEEALEGEGVEFALMETEARGHGTELAREAAKEFDVVVAVGGDGTVQEVMRGLLGTEATMGIIPAGTGNDFAKAIGMPGELGNAVSDLVRADVSTVDVGRIRWTERGADGSETEGERAFTNCAGCGFDAAAACATHRYKLLGGRLAYVAGVLETLWKWRKPDVVVEISANGLISSDGVVASERTHVHRGRFFFVEIDNGYSVGGGFLLTPDALINDGLLDVCFVEHLSTIRALRLMPKTFSGAHIGEPEVRIFHATSVHLTATKPLPVQADGEILSTSAVALDVEILPGALRILAPAIRLPVPRS